MKTRKKLKIKYSFVDYEKLDRQKKLDDAFDVIFDEIELDDFSNVINPDSVKRQLIAGEFTKDV